MSPDLQKSMSKETLDASRDAICGAFGVLPALFNSQAQGPLVREAQRHLAQWTLQPVAALLAEEASEKFGAEVAIDTQRPLHAFDAGGRSRALATIIEALAAAKQAGVDPGPAFALVDGRNIMCLRVRHGSHVGGRRQGAVARHQSQAGNFETVVVMIHEGLEAGQPSKFFCEGRRDTASARHSVCTAGPGGRLTCRAEIVVAALNILGAIRPTWKRASPNRPKTVTRRSNMTDASIAARRCRKIITAFAAKFAKRPGIAKRPASGAVRKLKRRGGQPNAPR